LVLFPGGPQRRNCLFPGAAVGARLGGGVSGVIALNLVAGAIHLLDLRPVGPVNAGALGLV
jgi:hypothetical protein